MKNKTFIKLGAIAVISAPIFIVISCGTKDDKSEAITEVKPEAKPKAKQNILQTKLEPSEFKYKK